MTNTLLTPGVYLVGDRWHQLTDGQVIRLKDRNAAYFALRSMGIDDAEANRRLVRIRPTLYEFKVPDNADYYSTLAAHPWAMEFDCHGCESIEHSQFQSAYSFVALLDKRQTINRRRSTYSLKADCERVVKTYVTERAYILAALLAGFRAACYGRRCYLNVVDDQRVVNLIKLMTQI